MTEYKKVYDNIEVPEKLSSIVDKNIERAERSKKYLFLRPLALIAASIMVFTLTVNTVPAVAQLMNNIPVLSGIAEFVKFDKGLSTAASKGYVQKVNLSAEDRGIKLTVKDIIFDKTRLLVYYKIDSNKEVKGINFDRFSLKNDKDQVMEGFLDVYYSTAAGSNSGINSKEDVLELNLRDDETLPETIKLEVESFKADITGEGEGQVIEGNWSIPIKLNSNMLNMKPRIIKYNKTAQIGPMEFKINDINIYPCSVQVNVEMNKDNSNKFCGFANARLVDDKGNEYSIKRSVNKNANTTVLYFESNYFIDTNALDIKFDGVFYMPKEPQIVQVDLKNSKLLNDPGFGINVMYAKHVSVPSGVGNETEYAVGFMVTDREIIKNMMVPGALASGIDFGRVYDNAGNDYQINMSLGSSIRSGNEEALERVLYFKDITTPPDVLNIEVYSYTKGSMEALTLKLQ